MKIKSKISNFKPHRYALSVLTLFLCGIVACGDAAELLDIALDPPSRKPIDKSLVAMNNFFVDSEFGTISQQYADISSNLGIKRIRVLFAWTEAVQPNPNSTPNYSFYDDIVRNAPPGVELLVVLSHIPNWATSPSTWVGGSARSTFVEKWVKPTAQRYAGSSAVAGFEIFNEPDIISLPQDEVLGLAEPENYFELLRSSYFAVRANAPSKKVVMAATTSIQRKFPTVLNYNRKLRDLGAEAYTDVWNVHYYATSYESVVTSNGVGDFLNGINKPIWVTESGETGPNKQLAYVETAWPFLKKEIPGIERFYYYQYGETGPLGTNFGLRTTDSAFPVSDLYLFLRDGTR